jgi:hypothetical protein
MGDNLTRGEMVDQETVKKLLTKLYGTKEEYHVIFSGKKSNAVNGLYKPEKREIIIHNKNFVNDNLLIYTAIHELAHHICIAEKGQRSARSHTVEFWSTFHDLLDVAEKEGIYTSKRNEKIDSLTAKARELDRKIAELQRELGEILIDIQKVCEESGFRAEDVFERDIHLSRKTWNYSIKAVNSGADKDCGQDIQKLLAGTRSTEIKNTIDHQKNRHKSAAQIQYGLQQEKTKTQSSLERLTIEKKRIETTIQSLKNRLSVILIEMAEQGCGDIDTREIADKRRE